MEKKWWDRMVAALAFGACVATVQAQEPLRRDTLAQPGAEGFQAEAPAGMSGMRPSDMGRDALAPDSVVADTLGAARVQMIGKLLIFWRPAEDETEEEASARIIAAAAAAARPEKAAAKTPAPSAKKKVASKKPGEKKQRKTEAPRRARPKRTRKTKKAMLAGK